MENFSPYQEKQRQNNYFMEKVKPENKDLMKKIIIIYDWKNSVLEAMHGNYDNSENLRNSFLKYFHERELYLNKISETL